MIGYEFLQSRIPLRMPPLTRPARVRSDTRIEAIVADCFLRDDVKH